MVQRYHPGAYHERSSLPVRAVERARTRAIVRLLDVLPHHRVLEVGVGAGNVLAEVPVGLRLGLDLSPSILRDARQRLGTRATLVQGDAAGLPFPDGAFDRVMASEVLEHLPNPGAAVREIARVTRTGGVVVLSVPNESLIDRTKDLLSRVRLLRWLSSSDYHVPVDMKDEWHLHAFDLDVLQEVAAPHLHVERVVAVPHALLPLRWVARCIPR
ncbi:MAG: methyltransferase domain-containing protein [Micrococcales bacterium]|nr:methyltransferase domain-containing protein [Micrococcales bacterium]